MNETTRMMIPALVSVGARGRHEGGMRGRPRSHERDRKDDDTRVVNGGATVTRKKDESEITTIPPFGE